MKYTPRPVDTRVNQPRQKPLLDLFWMMTGLTLILLLLYAASGWVIDTVARKIPAEFDNELYDNYAHKLQSTFGPEIDNPDLINATRRVFEQLSAQLPGDNVRRFHLVLVDDDRVNALAAPGGYIIVFKGLLDELESENELAMVLAHEFGHLQHQHHWKRIGRGLLFSAVIAALTGRQDAFQARLSASALTGAQRGYDRNQESEADQYGLRLVCQLYGHSGGSVDFFKRHIEPGNKPGKLSNFYLTHPPSADRVNKLRLQAQELGCETRAITPWNISPDT